MKTFLKALLPLLIVLRAQAGDLDEPTKKEITVRSEIKRGLAAVAALSPPERPLYYHRAVTAIVSDNEQRNEDTKAFVFGVNYASWHVLWNALSDKSYSDPFEAQIAAAHANICYTIAMEMQRQIGLSDNDLRDVCGHYFNAGEADRFRELLKSKQFANTYALASNNGSRNR
jgi:hypothetical protein